MTPWTAARQASLSITNSRSPPKPMSIESMMPSNHLILCRPLLLLPSIFPSIRVFSNESALCIRYVLEFQLQHQSFQWTPRTDLLQDGLVGSPCSPRDSQTPSPTPQFKSINSSALSFLYSPTLTSVKFNKIIVIISVTGLEMPFPLPPKIILNLKTHHNVLWFPAVNRSLNGHRCKPLWPKSPPRKGRVDAEGGAENARLWAKPRQGSPGQSGWKRKFTHGSRVRTRSLSPGGASPGFPESPGGSGAGVRGAGGGSRWVGVVVSALWRVRAPPPGRWGAARAALRALSCMPETQFHYSAEFGDSWSLRERQWWWSPVSRTGEHHSCCHQGRSWQAPALPGGGGVVDYAAYLSSLFWGPSCKWDA